MLTKKTLLKGNSAAIGPKDPRISSHHVLNSLWSQQNYAERLMRPIWVLRCQLAETRQVPPVTR